MIVFSLLILLTPMRTLFYLKNPKK